MVTRFICPIHKVALEFAFRTEGLAPMEVGVGVGVGDTLLGEGVTMAVSSSRPGNWYWRHNLYSNLRIGVSVEVRSKVNGVGEQGASR